MTWSILVYGTFTVVTHTGWALTIFSALGHWGDQEANGFWKVVEETYVGEVQNPSLKVYD